MKKKHGSLIGALVCAIVFIAGCVTESTGRKLPDSSDTEAAQLNLQLGVSYFRQNDMQSAQRKLEKAIEQDPDLVAAHTALGLVYERLGDIDGADRHYRRAVQIAPQDPDALNALAAYLCRTPDGRRDALGYFDRAISVPLSTQVSNKALLNTNAGVCAKPFDLARAENYLRAALANDDQFAEALIQMADVAYQRGNHLQSRAFLERYLSKAEPSSAVLWLGVRVENALGDAAAASEYGEQLKRDFAESVETRLLLEQERNAG